MASELERRRHAASAVEAARPDALQAIKMLGLNPKDPRAHALMLVCQRYDLDPFLGHVTIYKDGGLYVHKDAYVHLANQHPAYEGYRIVRQWEDERNWWAHVEVYRKGWRVPSVGTARSAKNKPRKDNKGTYLDEDADEKAVSKALRRALKRAFNVDWPHPEYTDTGEPVQPPEPVAEVARRVAEATAGLPPTLPAPPEAEYEFDPETGEVYEAADEPPPPAEDLDEYGWPPEPDDRQESAPAGTSDGTWRPSTPRGMVGKRGGAP